MCKKKHLFSLQSFTFYFFSFTQFVTTPSAVEMYRNINFIYSSRGNVVKLKKQEILQKFTYTHLWIASGISTSSLVIFFLDKKLTLKLKFTFFLHIKPHNKNIYDHIQFSTALL